MSPWLIGVLALGTVAAAWWVAQLGTGRVERSLQREREVTGDAIRDALRSGDKIAAIKLLRQQAGLGLTEARDAIEALERGGALPAPAAGGNLPPAEEPEIRRLLAAGKKIEAIKRYREATGLGLKEAKDAVEAME